jgi:hypothetical protein
MSEEGLKIDLSTAKRKAAFESDCRADRKRYTGFRRRCTHAAASHLN